MTDSHGLPLEVTLTPGQRQEATQLRTLLNSIRIPRPGGQTRQRPARLAGDKGYSYDSIRRWLRAHRIKAVIPRKSNQRKSSRPFDKQSYRRRAVIEQCVGWLKEWRRIGTRFEKLAVSFLAMLKLAMIRQYFKALFSDTA